MCWRRRGYYSCSHENHNITPPYPIKFCQRAEPRGHRGRCRPCGPIDTLPLTPQNDLIEAELYSGLCERCTLLGEVNVQWERVRLFCHQNSFPLGRIAAFEARREIIITSPNMYEWASAQQELVDYIMRTPRQGSGRTPTNTSPNDADTTTTSHSPSQGTNLNVNNFEAGRGVSHHQGRESARGRLYGDDNGSKSPQYEDFQLYDDDGFLSEEPEDIGHVKRRHR
ncbi:hypothetical protein F4779DRAFT_640339 [Xylariaceae sp. FL0662B]|nr:hypothetical protein F4779DRAFT_640339 [Xylariaceae sp. FL0662B]